jgi:hypothetical protein
MKTVRIIGTLLSAFLPTPPLQSCRVARVGRACTAKACRCCVVVLLLTLRGQKVNQFSVLHWSDLAPFCGSRWVTVSRSKKILSLFNSVTVLIVKSLSGRGAFF